MTKITYYFTLSSPWTFIGDPILREISSRHNVPIEHRPMDMGQVLANAGGVPLPQRSDARKALRMQELIRWRDFRGIEFNLTPKHFPAKGADAGHLVVAAQLAGHDVGDLVYAYMRAVWQEERNIDDEDTIIAIANENGMDGRALFDARDNDDVNAQWAQNTRDAMTSHAVGSPVYIVGEEIYWGQDRLDFVERHIESL